MADVRHGKGWGRGDRKRALRVAREEERKERREAARALAAQVRSQEVAPVRGEVQPDLQGLPRVGGEW